MKTRSFQFVLLLLLMIPIMPAAQTFEKLWNEVEKAQKSGLPQTAIKHAEAIFRKAEAEKNSGQMLKAYTARMTYRRQIAPDSFYVDLKGLEEWAANTTIHEDCAVLHTLIAAIYSDYANQYQWNLRRRTDVADTPSDDVRHWSSNMFVDKVLDHTRVALEDSILLFELSSKEYIPFVVQQPASRYYNHNMYQLLASYGINSLKTLTVLGENATVINAIDNIYDRLIRMYRRQENREAYLLLNLERTDWWNSEGRYTKDNYLKTLDDLIKNYNESEIALEAYLAKAQLLMRENMMTDALQTVSKGISLHPKYERVNALVELRDQILRPNLTVNMNGASYPGDSLSINVSHANLNGFTVNCFKVNLPATSPELQKAIDDNFLKKYTRKTGSEHFSLVRPDDYLPKDTTFALSPLQQGIYVVQIMPDDKSAKPVSQLLSVSKLKLLSRALPENQIEVVVLDAKSGKPVEDATVQLFTSNRGDMTLANTLKTNADGRAVTPSNSYVFIRAEKDADTSILHQHFFGGYYDFSDRERMENSTLVLLTDRSLYRPGQTVYVKGIAYSQLSDTANVLPNRKYTLILQDANVREVSRKEFTTNEFGSFTGEFILPTGVLNGMFMLRNEGGRAIAIRVEEYKRPTFEIAIDNQEGTYQLNDTVNVKGTVRTFSGVPVQELPVSYEVSRRLFGWWKRAPGMSTTIQSGTATLNDKGEFTLPVALTSGDKKDLERGFYTFTVTVTVTNVAGETQSSTASLSVGNRSLILHTDIQQRINKDEEIKATFSATNLSNNPVNVKGEYRLYRVTDIAKRTVADTPTSTGTFTSNVETPLPEWKSLPTGMYRLVLTANDELGREAKYEMEIILFSIQDKRPVEGIGQWFYPINLDFDGAHAGEFLFGTSQQDAYVLMDVFSGNKRLESRLLHISDSVMRFTYPYKAEYGNGLTITFCYVKDGEVFMQEVALRRRLPEKELKLTWNVFRDKLRPGQQEEWKLTIKNPDGTSADAEMLATMYDASLDRIWRHDQQLSVNYWLNLPSLNWWVYRADNNFYGFAFSRTLLKYPRFAFDAFWLSPFGLSRFDGRATRESLLRSYAPPQDYSRAAGVTLQGDMVAKQEERVNLDRVAEAVSVSDREPEMDMGASEMMDLPTASANLRTNFAETAFFYPQLRTNENGEIVIAFTMPESLTRWKFNGYAHTKGMLTGMISGETVTSKEFMLTPNLPRFVRVGDKTSVAASVANLTENPVSGNVVMTLFDPMTEKVISTQKQKFTTTAGQTTGVNFTFTATDQYAVLGCRLVAEGGTFSDGEQHLLPVLSNKERVIETVAMPIRGKQTREFPLANLFNNNSKTATNRSLTVEFSGNPAWYAVQALPSLSLPTDDNAISWATAYYANTLASYIMNSQPRLKAVFDTWKAQTETKETFLSNLQKNQDVKNILLEESPWVLESTTEQEQKLRIALLFDLNNIRNNNLTALNKLRELQLSSGAWTWFKGMPASRYITTYVMQSLIRLKTLTGQMLDADVTAMYADAFRYLHREAVNEYTALRKAGGEDKRLSASALQYLYFIALSGERVPNENQTAYSYYLNRLKPTIATQSITEKAMAAVILQKAGRTADAQGFIASLKEFSTQTDERGMFFAFNESPLTWAGLKVPAHVAVMEAFDAVGGQAENVEEMKLWLLSEKQTQQWNSPVATANAVYALLYRGTSLTDNQGDVRVTLGNKTLETLSATSGAIPGIAYVKQTITDPKALSNIKKAVVEKRDAGMAYGAVFAQYEEELDKITSHGEGLHIDKKLYIERVTGAQKELVPITSDTRLSVGDKVVSRITIRLDRAMDFVQLKDQRATCFEPESNLSGYTHRSDASFYIAVKDASTNFFFDSLNKGVYVLEHSYRVSRTGVYESGLATIQSAYAPEYASHAPSVKVEVK